MYPVSQETPLLRSRVFGMCGKGLCLASASWRVFYSKFSLARLNTASGQPLMLL